jgi:hypothetical protein
MAGGPSQHYLRRDPDEEPEGLDDEPDLAARLDPEPDPERLDPERLDPERLDEERLDEPERPDADPERFADEPDREDAERDEPERLDEPRADEPDRLDFDAEPERELLAREPERRDPLDERLEPFDAPRELLDDERRELERDRPLRRSAAGISSLATALASCVICFSRKLAIRSSSRRMERASLAVSLSLTASASASMPV